MIYFYAIWGMLDVLAIILVINEDIFYEIEDKVFKIFWILLLPIIGAIYAMIKLHGIHNYTSPKCDNSHNIHSDVRTYEFVDSNMDVGAGE